MNLGGVWFSARIQYAGENIESVACHEKMLLLLFIRPETKTDETRNFFICCI